MTVAIAATPLASCSGDVSKKDFIDAADDLCRAADERIREIGVPRVEEGIRDYVVEAKRIAEELVSELRDLEVPPGDQDVVAELTEGFERAADLLDPVAEAAAEADTAALEELQQQVEQATDEVNEVAESYGFETCGAQVLDPQR